MRSGSSKINSVYTRLFFVVLYIAAITLFDSFAYGIIYEKKIKNEKYENRAASWVFKESKPAGAQYVEVPNYRIIQKALEISGLLVIIYFFGLWPAVGLLISHYFLTYDLLYYIFLNQTGGLKMLEGTFGAYWLTNWYQSGYFLLQPFKVMNFYLSGLAGLIIAVMFCFVQRQRFFYHPLPPSLQRRG